MPDKLFIQFEKLNLRWLVIEESGKHCFEPRQGQMEELLSTVKSSEIYILVPAKNVLLSEIKLPKLSQRNLKKALPFALADKLVDEFGKVHVSIGRIIKKAKLPVAVVSKVKMNEWNSDLKPLLHEKTDLSVVMVSEALALPFNARGWAIYLDDETALVRLGAFTGFGVDPKKLWPLLRLYLSKDDSVKPSTIELFGNAGIPPAEAEFFRKEKIELELKPVNDKLMLMADSMDKNSIINLFQGEYQLKQAPLVTSKIFMIGLFLLASWALILTLGNLSKMVILETQSHRISQEIKSIYQTISPSAPFASRTFQEVLEKQLRLLKDNLAGGRFLRVIAEISPAFSGLPGIQLSGLNYDNAVLILDLEVSSFADIDKLIERLKIRAFQIEHEDEVKTMNLIHARLTIKEPKE
jgi:general secretion pathway protein L